ncbi:MULTISPECIES: insulinase family protein [unclassified Pseudodesulfovibrio]|uniref:insulinase family protein n=1 Tax=unclassified Pseudodesulfovibrio TaxID=2661612 RepID=UPI000FEBA74A|nr:MULTISPECIES: insulinase family protein [unclassified Pseudodesulfovibrio]MCJ2165628.1 insulinase family protein [Pseudodesulfovibrio sp. S3-i]RWU03035.1 peptidase M16 [Pseudodesulfovibrio sp. S3]
MSFGFTKIREMEIEEMATTAIIYRHDKTGARVLSMINDDENKVFGISFRTPPKDSTGVAHILEHSVLCGSDRYPVREPFVELLKGSLQTFLNALTFPDKTCYPVASANVQDFYNLIDVYLDAVFHPRLTENTLKQEGWHYELESREKSMTYKGVVFNEMKGAYSSPDSLLHEHSQQSLFPDVTYGLDSGGDPATIPDLTFEQFMAFHRDHYHPSNGYAFFYGDDDPQKRLEILDAVFSGYEAIDVAETRVPLQERFAEARSVRKGYPASDRLAKGMFTVNWLLAETADANLNLALHILEHILIGLPSSPLKKALTDSGLGDDLAGVGLEADMRQMFFSVGLKGMHPSNAIKAESIIFHTIKELVENGIDVRDIEAAVNSVEFSLRENNTGSYPRGLSLMFQALSTWIYDDDGQEGDPLILLPFEQPLKNIKAWIEKGDRIFEELLARLFLHNPHRTTVLLEPDHKMARRMSKVEIDRLAAAKDAMTPEQLDAVIADARELNRLQAEPDSVDALNTIPRLSVSDLPAENRIIPAELRQVAGRDLLYHDLSTNGIGYLDFGFDLSVIPDELLPYTGIFGRALVESGTTTRDYVDLSQRIARTSGGIWTQAFASPIRDSRDAAARLFVRTKATAEKMTSTLEILTEILTSAKLDNKERLSNIVSEARARAEQRLIPSGHMVVATRLRARTHTAHAMDEAMSGLTNLHFLRDLEKRMEDDFRNVAKDLERFRSLLLNQGNLLVNATMDADIFSALETELASVVGALPQGKVAMATRTAPQLPRREGLAIPAQVNYVGKGCSVAEHGFVFTGAAQVVNKLIRTGYLWEKVRVQGGAYGAFCIMDRLAGALAFVSYRDPNVADTVAAFDAAADYLETVNINGDELEKSIIGAIGEIDSYQLPDAKGFTSLIRHLTGQDNGYLQIIRDQVLSATEADFRAFAQAVRINAQHGDICVLGDSLAMENAGLDLELEQVL